MAGGLLRYLRLFRLFVRTELQFEMEYRANLVMEIAMMGVVIVTSVAAVLVMFGYTDELNGWTFPEMLALLGVYYIVQGLAETLFQPSMEKLMEHIRLGTLDFALLKPANSQFLTTLRHLQMVQVVQSLVGVGVLVYAVGQMGEQVSIWQGAAFAVALFCGAVVVYALLLALVTLSFWFVRVENLLAIYWAFMDAGRFPIDVYPGWLRVTMSTVVPVGIAITVPSQAISGRLDATGLAILVAGTLLAWRASTWFFHLGLRSYTGASA